MKLLNWIGSPKFHCSVKWTRPLVTDPLPSLITEELANDKSLHTRQVGITQGLEKKRLFSSLFRLPCSLLLRWLPKRKLNLLLCLLLWNESSFSRSASFYLGFIWFTISIQFSLANEKHFDETNVCNQESMFSFRIGRSI